MDIPSIVIWSIVAILVISAIVSYNHLVELRNGFKNAFAQIDVQLQRRYDLIPNLVESAKAYMAHERETLEAVIQARNQAMASAREAAAHPESGAALEQLTSAEGALGGLLQRLFALAESYPDLKANQTIQQLMEEITSTENRVGFARQAFNDAVMVYNTAREQFPNTLFAALFSFSEAQLLTLQEPAARQGVKVDFS